jgi:hypothetical protein
LANLLNVLKNNLATKFLKVEYQGQKME